MVEIVQEERKKDPLLKNLDVLVGINTGKIISGIIGTKIVRYDIFGQDVLISALVMLKCNPGMVCVSESMRKIMMRRMFVYDTFFWQEWGHVEVPESELVLSTYSCEQIFAELDSYSIDQEIDPVALTDGKPGATPSG